MFNLFHTITYYLNNYLIYLNKFLYKFEFTNYFSKYLQNFPYNIFLSKTLTFFFRLGTFEMSWESL